MRKFTVILSSGLFFGSVQAPSAEMAVAMADMPGCRAVGTATKAAEAARLASRKADFARQQEASRP